MDDTIHGKHDQCERTLCSAGIEKNDRSQYSDSGRSVMPDDLLTRNNTSLDGHYWDE